MVVVIAEKDESRDCWVKLFFSFFFFFKIVIVDGMGRHINDWRKEAPQVGKKGRKGNVLASIQALSSPCQPPLQLS